MKKLLITERAEKRAESYLGAKFGLWTVIGIGYQKHRQRYVMCRCECGFEQGKNLSSLITGHVRGTRGCRNCNKRAKMRPLAVYRDDMIERNLQIQLDYVGKRFRNVTVMEFAGYRFTDRKPVFKVQCDCGEVSERTAASLRREDKDRFFCHRCSPKKDFTMYGMISQAVLGRLTSVAAIRNIDFSVTPEYLTELFERQEGRCALTGWPINISKKTGDKKHTASLDRIDSSGSYSVGNVQWVNKDVNRMKWAYNQEDFINMCRAVAEKFAEPHDCDPDWGDE